MRTFFFFRGPHIRLLCAVAFTLLATWYLFISFNKSDAGKPDVVRNSFNRIHQPSNQNMEVLIDHRGPHQPDAVQRHIEEKSGGILNKGELPDNAVIAQNALNAIHERARDNEQQAGANIPPPIDVRANESPVKMKAIDDKNNDLDVIPPQLIPRVPPPMSNAYSIGPGE